MSTFTNEILTYSQPHPFVLPGEIKRSTGWQFYYKVTTETVTEIPFDGRYLEEIMFNINKARTTVYGKSAIRFKTYTPKGEIKETFLPSLGRSFLNNRISIMAFASIVEDIKDAIEDTIEAPDHLASHFGRCFNNAHYTGFPFISMALIEQYPNIKTNMQSAGTPFYTFPENLSGESMHGLFHRFEYNLPSISNPERKLLVQAFQTARKKLKDGIPLLTRMQNGQWPVTKDELLTILGLSIYSKSSDFNKRPAERSGYTSEADRYTIGDHKRIFYTFCSFIIQALRYQVPKCETFNQRYSQIQRNWWVSKWTLSKINCSTFWSTQRTSKMWDFTSGKWHFCGHGECDGEGLLLDVPPPGWASSVSWFTGCETIDQEMGAILPYGFSPAQWFGRTDCQDDKYESFYTFHKYQTFELVTEEPVAAFTQGGAGLMTRLTMGGDQPAYVRVGGRVSAPVPWGNTAGEVTLFGAPITGINIYDKFEENNTQELSKNHNAVTSITIALQDWQYYNYAKCNYTGNERGATKAKITYLGFLDDMPHDPVDFLG